MNNCELCGKEKDLVSTLIEGVKFRVCGGCSKFGKVIEGQVIKKIEKKDIKREEFVDIVLDNCGSIIKNFREKEGLSQHDLSIKLNEKESTLAKIEQGNLKPSIELAKKLEKFFGATLVAKEKISEAPVVKASNTSLTIGDFLKKDS